MRRKVVHRTMLPVLLASVFLLTMPVSGITTGIELKYRTPNSLPQGWVYVLVEASVFTGIQASLDQYATDLESIDGFSVGIYTVATSTTPTAIRAFLQQAFPEGLVGCFLVGDIPEPYYEWSNEYGHYRHKTDFYYMDLDGVWSDTDSDGTFDMHSGEADAEIWVGSIQPSLVNGDSTQLLNNYFHKNHLYRTGKLNLPKRALAYLDDGGWDLAWCEWWVTNTVKIAYGEMVIISDPEMTVASDYENRLLEGYEWIYLSCHGSYGYHRFMHHGSWDGTLTGLDYRSIDPRAFFYVLMPCSSASGSNNLAGSVVFTDTYGLGSIGTRAGSPWKWGPDTEFYEALSEEKSIGEAYLEDLSVYEYEIPGYEHHWTITGDPSLHIKGYPPAHQPVHNIDTGEDFASIQEAINDSDTLNGHTILADAGTYFEHVNVDKSISLIGESKDTTIIDGFFAGTVVSVTTDDVTISGFTIQNSGYEWPNGSGIYLDHADECTVSGSNIVNNWLSGIELWYSSNNTISENNLMQNYWLGIGLMESSSYNIVSGNNITDNGSHADGIDFYYCSDNIVSGNNITNNSVGIWLGHSSNNTVSENDITHNIWRGIHLESSSDNLFYHNNFIDSPVHVLNEDPASSINTWDDGYPSGGNYWGDYTDVDFFHGPGQDELGSDGIWDHPYVIDANNQDNYPLMLEPWDVVVVTVDIYPDTLNVHSLFGKSIKAYIEVPDGYDLTDIDIATVKLNSEVQAEPHPTEMGDYDKDGIPDLMVKFDRTDVVRSILRTGESTLVVTGMLVEKIFVGIDTIRVLGV